MLPSQNNFAAIKFIFALFPLYFLIFSGCATLHHQYETPAVSITSFKALQTESPIPQFEIALRIVNPNRSALALKGISYTIALDGHNVITGVSNTLPRIEAYDEGIVILNASVDLIKSIQFFSDIIGNNKDEISYNFTAKLDIGTLYPLVKIEDKGKVSLTGSPKR